jgi:hypothetical protein
MEQIDCSETSAIINQTPGNHPKVDILYFYAYNGNTAIDHDPLPVSHACLTVVEPALFE